MSSPQALASAYMEMGMKLLKSTMKVSQPSMNDVRCVRQRIPLQTDTQTQTQTQTQTHTQAQSRQS
jgi:hypothetical protein